MTNTSGIELESNRFDVSKVSFVQQHPPVPAKNSVHVAIIALQSLNLQPLRAMLTLLCCLRDWFRTRAILQAEILASNSIKDVHIHNRSVPFSRARDTRANTTGWR